MDKVESLAEASSSLAGEKKKIVLKEHIVEIVSDAGEGAQKAGQAFGAVSARSGNGIWTVEIIPAEIQPPPRSKAGGSGNRIRVGSFYITNAGDEADLVVAFNEQALLGRYESDNLKPDAIVLLESKWRDHADPEIKNLYHETINELKKTRLKIYEVPMERECLKIVDNAQRGKNMWALGMLCSVYSRDLEAARNEIRLTFAKKGEKVINPNIDLLEAGYAWAEENLDLKFAIPSAGITKPQIVVNGNQAIALGILASGMDVCAMYPITPATSASHFLSEIFENVGGVVHQAEDEIAAAAFAVGASYAGKCAVTITSGPGMSLKTEVLGLASMAEIPLVVVDVQRGGPSTGLPTKVEQGDLLMSVFHTHGDAPKIVMAPATIEDCYYAPITARKIAETFRMPVYVLTDANLATGQQPFTKPEFKEEWVAPPFDQSPVPDGKAPYDWDEETGLSKRIIPGQPNGMHTVTGLAHSNMSKVAYEPKTNQDGCDNRSKKLAAFQKTLQTPKVYGKESGDVLVVGWGSTKGVIEEAVDTATEKGYSVSSLHLKYLQPMASGIKEILQNYKKVITVEINYSDDPKYKIFDENNRRYANLAWLLRARYLIDVDCWSNVYGQPIKPHSILDMLDEHFTK